MTLLCQFAYKWFVSFYYAFGFFMGKCNFLFFKDHATLIFNIIILFSFFQNTVFVQKQSSRGFCKKGVLRNVAKFTEKHLRQSLFFNKVAGLRPATLLKKTLCHRGFSVNFAKFLRTPILTEHLCWLFLFVL